MNVETHCMNVTKVYDWINQMINLKAKECVSISNGEQGDFCINFNIPCDGTRALIWDGSNVDDFTGNYTVTISDQCTGNINLFVNGIYITTLSGGESYSAPFTDLQSVEVQCEAETGIVYCSGSLYIQSANQNNDPPEFEINCFLSDALGNQIDPRSENAICCEEQSDPDNRISKEFIINGETVTLQEVDIVVKAFITIQFIDDMGDLLGQCVLPFWDAETVYLCAPTGTSIECKLSDFNCKVNFVELCGPCAELCIRISMCLSVFATIPVTIRLSGNWCEPRVATFSRTPCPM
ncbi:MULTISPECIES: S-Ena type endospore appendage [Clostridia]|uniref:S-Ena type endospore appendage n=1 Tax=Clostridia TaxID=186801 RepID=UPI000EA14CBB|nr:MULTISPECIES: S-Ena type endospore appendage [Clostridia]NBJ71557.1 hypothetical protein [Roseburia sp. 1XD42-34]RKI74203.1 hypothetical protein D7V87_19270 [Clostridium sp. 1xD42-85]